MNDFYGNKVTTVAVVFDLARAAKISGDLVLVAIYAKDSHSPLTDSVKFQEMEARLKAVAMRVGDRRATWFRNVPKDIRDEANLARVELKDFLNFIQARHKQGEPNETT